MKKIAVLLKTEFVSKTNSYLDTDRKIYTFYLEPKTNIYRYMLIAESQPLDTAIHACYRVHHVWWYYFTKLGLKKPIDWRKDVSDGHKDGNFIDALAVCGYECAMNSVEYEALRNVKS